MITIGNSMIVPTMLQQVKASMKEFIEFLSSLKYTKIQIKIELHIRLKKNIIIQ